MLALTRHERRPVGNETLTESEHIALRLNIAKNAMQTDVPLTQLTLQSIKHAGMLLGGVYLTGQKSIMRRFIRHARRAGRSLTLSQFEVFTSKSILKQRMFAITVTGFSRFVTLLLSISNPMLWVAVIRLLTLR